MSQVSGNKCELSCVHFTGFISDKAMWGKANQSGNEKLSFFKCKAFPGGIPMEIIDLEFDHTKPYPGDKGIRFEPV